jgi:hypothetical protein
VAQKSKSLLPTDNNMMKQLVASVAYVSGVNVWWYLIGCGLWWEDGKSVYYRIRSIYNIIIRPKSSLLITVLCSSAGY